MFSHLCVGSSFGLNIECYLYSVMYREAAERQKLFSRRAAILGGLQFTMAGVLAGRMYQLQVLESDRYRTLADENRINMRLLVPPRGRILDRNGQPLAVNRKNYRVLLTAEQSPNIIRTLETLSRLVDINDFDRENILREIRRRRGFVPVTIKENLDWNTVSRIEVNAPDLPGVSIDLEQSREYLHGYEISHVLGYVSPPSPNEAGNEPLLQLPGFRVGKSGIERMHEMRLRGKAGNSQFEVNALGRVIRELDRKEGVPGNDVILTIDLQLQKFAIKKLVNQKSAAAVVMDVKNGAILCLVSVPGYDPNAFNIGFTQKNWQMIRQDPYSPLINKAISGHYSPGSTFKMSVALAALKYNVISPKDIVFCPGHYSLGQGKFHCWSEKGHGALDMRGAIQQSCDVYFYEIAKRLGVDRIAEMASTLGLGDLTGIDLPGERRGLVPTVAWKKGALGESWQGGETLVAGIGQGFVLSTPLQLVVMTARLATGREIKPHLLRAVVSEGVMEMTNPKSSPTLKVNQDHLNIVLGGMDSVVNSSLGTARESRILGKDKRMAGKTGTSQVRRISRRERETRVLKNEEKPWKERDHSLFVAFAPFEDPRYAISVVVEHGGSGSKVAAPIARDILQETLRRKVGLFNRLNASVPTDQRTRR